MELSTCLKALGDPTRFMIFQQLLIRKHCTRSLSKKLGFTEATISQHLKILYEAGMVYKEKYGYHMHYLPTQAAVDFLASSFDEMRHASLALNRDPKVCQCEYRQQMENEPIKQIMEKEQDTTFTENLAADIQENLRKICTPDIMKHIEVVHLDQWVNRYLRSHEYVAMTRAKKKVMISAYGIVSEFLG